LERSIRGLLREQAPGGRQACSVGSWALCAEILARTDRVAAASAEQAALLLQASPALRSLPLPEAGPGLPQVPVYLLWHQRTHTSRPHRWLRQRVRAHLAAGVPEA